jgi:hypothetical protein
MELLPNGTNGHEELFSLRIIEARLANLFETEYTDSPSFET